MFNRQQLKSEAKDLMRRGGGKMFKTVILYLVIALILAQLMLLVQGSASFERRYRARLTEAAEIDATDAEAVQQFMDDYYNNPIELPERTAGASIVVLLLSVVSGMLSTGYQWWSLRGTRGDLGEPRSIFDVFQSFFKVLMLTLIKSLLFTIGVLLFVVPGIFLALIYSQAEYILFEDPNAGAIDCMRRSRQLMGGHLGEYFVLILSFLGWEILAVFAASIISAVAFMSGLSMVTTMLVVLFIAQLWLTPYMQFTYAGYYNYLTNYKPEEPVQEVTE